MCLCIGLFRYWYNTTALFFYCNGHIAIEYFIQVIHLTIGTLHYEIPNTLCCYCTLLFKSNGIYFSNAYLIYPWSIFWSKLLTWHLSSVWWGWCEISYAYDYSSRLNDHSKSIRFEKRDIKTLATGTVFGGYFIIRDRMLWELKLFLFHGIEMKLVHKIILCVSGLELKLNLS